MKIKVEKPDQETLKSKGVFSWPVWEKEVSRFDWFYSDQEACYFLEGKVDVETSNGDMISIGKGDFVVFPKGLRCVWNVKIPVKKHYNFG